MSGIAVLFPGQGAQAVGMGLELYQGVPECHEIFEHANEVLGHDLASLCFKGPQEELTRSSHAQPAIFVHSVAAYSALKRRRPALAAQAMAGLSSGEWTALHIAQVISFADTLRVLQARGEFMQEACEEQPGVMLSVIGLSAEALEPIARSCGVQIANLNSPEQTVLSGAKEKMAEAEQRVKEAGAKKAIPLAVAGAFHSELMRSAGHRLASFLADIPLSAPRQTVLSNVTGRPHENPDTIRKLMTEQVTSPVQWVAGVQWMQQHGVQTYVECGPGRVLSGLVKRIDKQATLHNIQDPNGLEAAAGALN